MRFVIFDTANKVSLITNLLFIFGNTLFMIGKKNSYCLCDSDTTATPPLKRNSKHKNQAWFWISQRNHQIINLVSNCFWKYGRVSNVFPISVFPAVRFACLRLFSDILDVLQMGFQQAAIVLGCFRCVAVRSEHKGCPGPVQWWHRCRMWTENLWQRSSNSQHRKDVHPIDIISICMLSLTHCTLCNKEVDSKV